MTGLRVLLVEDSLADADLVTALLEEGRVPVLVEHAPSLSGALTALSAAPWDVALVDLSLPDAWGLDVVETLRAAYPELPLVVLTGLEDETMALDALASGAQDYVSKSELTPQLVLRALRYACERARADAAARRAARLSAALLDGLEAPTCAVDGAGRVLAVNKAMRHQSEGSLLTCEPGDDLSVLWRGESPEAEAQLLLIGLRDVLEGRRPRFELEYEAPDDVWWSIRITPLPAETGAVVMTVDVTAMKRAQQELRRAALHDGLTGLPNRTLLLDRMDQAFVHTARSGGVVAALFLDVDRFKGVNDTLGHAAGDRVLVELSHRLLRVSRATDTVARVSGDEFVVVWVDTSEAGARTRSERVVAAVNGTVEIEGREVPVTASAGLAVGTAETTAEELLRAADEAMYAAKSHGGARLDMASTELRAQMDRRRRVERLVEEALEDDRLEVHYQPVVQLATGRPTGVEALVRVRDRDGRLVSPGEFIEVAERVGLIVPMGAAVLDKACAEAASWSGNAAALTVAVNLSTRQLAQPDVVATVEASLRRSGLAADRLVLEVTESAVVEDAEAALRAMTALKELGVRTAIDDFGTGYSSFLYLKRFPVDLLKIDRSFVAGMLESPDDAAIVASVVRLGRDVGLGLIAEGVETEAQRHRLVQLGCTDAQGYLFARPVPADELAAALAGTERPLEPQPLRPRRGRPAVDRAVLARMHQMYGHGASTHTIAAVLNGEGALNPEGRRWHAHTVGRCLAASSATA
jgi:diguanylate cyclase (GGDEF)-like protein